MDFSGAVEARFLRRVNRFVAEVALSGGEITQAHVANTGRMQELLIPGTACLVRPAANPARKTAWDLLAIDAGGHWVCLVARWANDFFGQWLADGEIEGFAGPDLIQREKKIGHSRFDFYVEQAGARWLFEVKSVNFVTAGHALFPDAPTSRGVRHVQELIALKDAGYETGVVFVTMGQPVVDVAFNRAHDPDFAQVMQEAQAAGLWIRAFAAEIVPPEVRFVGARPIIFEE